MQAVGNRIVPDGDTVGLTGEAAVIASTEGLSVRAVDGYNVKVGDAKIVGATVERDEEFVCMTQCGGATASHLLFTQVKALLQHDEPAAHTW